MDDASVFDRPFTRGRELRCLEVWGGTSATREAASVYGLDIYIAAEPFPGSERGGDIYFVSMCGAGNVARFVLADVAGHGDTISRVSRSLRKILERHISTVDQTRLVREINREFTAIARHGCFATAVMATYYAPTDDLTVVNAGHPPPLLFRAESDAWYLLETVSIDDHLTSVPEVTGVPNIPLGVLASTPYRQFSVHLARGDIVVLYTDSLIESKAPDGSRLGSDGLLDLVRCMDASEFADIVDSIRSAIAGFRHGLAADDDETVIVIHHNAADPPPLSMRDRLRMLGWMMGVRPRRDPSTDR